MLKCLFYSKICILVFLWERLVVKKVSCVWDVGVLYINENSMVSVF